MICQTRIKCKSIIRDYFNDNSDVLPILDNVGHENQCLYLLIAFSQVSRRLVNDYSIIGTDDNRITPSLLIARYCDVYLRKGYESLLFCFSKKKSFIEIVSYKTWILPIRLIK